MTTASDLIETTKTYLFAGAREPLNLLSGAHSNSTTTFTFTYDIASQLNAGAYVSVDLEVVYVWSLDTTAKTALVQRGMLGTTATSHASGAVTTANPKFPDSMILSALNASLAELSSPSNGLFQIVKVTPTYNGAIDGYDLTGITSLLDVYAITYDEPGPSKTWPSLPYKLLRDANTSDFPSGFGVVLKQAAHPGTTIRVQCQVPFTALTTTAQDVQTIAGLPASANDIPPLGAAVRLTSVRETQRNFNETQPGTRRAEEVPPGAQLAGTRALLALYQRRIKEESARLLKSYPPRRELF